MTEWLLNNQIQVNTLPVPTDTILKYLDRAKDVAEKVMKDYDQQFILQKSIFYINYETSKMWQIQIHNEMMVERMKNELRAEEREKHKSDRSTSEALNKRLKWAITDNEYNRWLIEKMIEPMLRWLIKLSDAVKDERINEMSQAKIAGTFKSSEWYWNEEK